MLIFIIVLLQEYDSSLLNLTLYFRRLSSMDVNLLMAIISMKAQDTNMDISYGYLTVTHNLKIAIFYLSQWVQELVVFL